MRQRCAEEKLSPAVAAGLRRRISLLRSFRFAAGREAGRRRNFLFIFAVSRAPLISFADAPNVSIFSFSGYFYASQDDGFR